MLNDGAVTVVAAVTELVKMISVTEPISPPYDGAAVGSTVVVNATGVEAAVPGTVTVVVGSPYSLTLVEHGNTSVACAMTLQRPISKS